MDREADHTRQHDSTVWSRPTSRRAFLRGAGLAGAVGLAGPMVLSGTARAASRFSGPFPLEHIIVDCQENRSFDHYYGYAPFAGPYGVPAGYAQPDGMGGFVTPYHFTSLATSDVGHSWAAMHAEYNGGAMDGFYTTDGIG